MGVEFNENKPVNYNYPAQKGGLTNLVIKLGLAKDEKGANTVMVIISIIFFIISIYLFLK
jgi:hypothetical protein